MGAWTLLQVAVDIILMAGLFLLSMRLLRAPKDDPRLSRGLQLLQSKISVIEDLSDRTEIQVQQLTALMDQKCREVQNKIQAAERQIQMIETSMNKSMDVAKIFQDKIPHQEIIERQNSRKYVQAARLAHYGKSVDEIIQEVDLPRGEVELITKLNREQLMFSEEQLPWWAQEAAEMQATGNGISKTGIASENEVSEPFVSKPITRDFSAAFDRISNRVSPSESVVTAAPPPLGSFENATATRSPVLPITGSSMPKAPPSAPKASPTSPLNELGEQFRKAVPIPSGVSTFVELAEEPKASNQTKEPNIRPVQFPRIKSTDNLG